MSDETAYEQTLIQYRLEQARNALRDAQTLDAEGGSPQGIINRAYYYAMFYAVLALLVTIGRGASKHKGVITLFDKEFVKRGTFPKEMSRMLHRAFDLRLSGDYREMVDVGLEEARLVLASAEGFVDRIEKKLAGQA